MKTSSLDWEKKKFSLVEKETQTFGYSFDTPFPVAKLILLGVIVIFNQHNLWS